MKTQEEIKNLDNGTKYYNQYFETSTTRLLTEGEYNQINEIIQMMVNTISEHPTQAFTINKHISDRLSFITTSFDNPSAVK